MRKVRFSQLNLLMALLAAMTLSLPTRVRVCGVVPAGPESSSSVPLQTGFFNASGLPGPAQTPLCHLRCRGFVASVPDAPAQQQPGVTAQFVVIIASLPPASTDVVLLAIVNSPPGSSPPLSNVLRL